jgi:BRCT domain type II-containing protein
MALLGRLLPTVFDTALQHAPSAVYYASQRLYAAKRTRTAIKNDPKTTEAPADSQASTSSVNSSSSSTTTTTSSSKVSAAKQAGVTAAVAARVAHASGFSSEQELQRLAALDAAMKHLNKKLGSGTIMRLGESPMTGMECISSGCLTLDIALGEAWTTLTRSIAL